MACFCSRRGYLVQECCCETRPTNTPKTLHCSIIFQRTQLSVRYDENIVRVDSVHCYTMALGSDTTTVAHLLLTYVRLNIHTWYILRVISVCALKPCMYTFNEFHLPLAGKCRNQTYAQSQLSTSSLRPRDMSNRYYPMNHGLVKQRGFNVGVEGNTKGRPNTRKYPWYMALCLPKPCM